MKILHIAFLKNDNASGVNVAVPKQIMSQNKERVEFININKEVILGLNCQINFNKKFLVNCEKNNRPDIIIFHEIYRPIYLKYYKQAMKEKIPYVIVPHGGLTKSAQKKKRIKKKIANKLFFEKFINNASAIQFLSEQEMSNSKVSVKKFIGTNGIDIGKFKNNFSEGKVQYTYIGRLEYKIKGLDILIKAINMKKDTLRLHNCRFDLYGPEEENEKKRINRLCCRYGISDLVHIHAPVFGKEKELILLNTDCYIQTSRSEGMSMGILEAMGYGIPILVTKGTGMADYVRNENLGWECDVRSEAIAKAIETSIKERQLFQIKGENARKLIEKKFVWDIVSRETLAQYYEIIELNKGAK